MKIDLNVIKEHCRNTTTIYCNLGRCQFSSDYKCMLIKNPEHWDIDRIETAYKQIKED